MAGDMQARPAWLKAIGAAMLAAIAGLSFASAADDPPKSPAEANWIITGDAEESLLVVTEPAGAPPGGTDQPEPDEAVVGLGENARPNVHGIAEEGAFTRITTQHIPDYTVTYSEALQAELEARPQFDTDFPDGIRADPGETIIFGQDIGYSGDVCEAGAGRGYWPPATFCSDANVADIYLPNSPQPAQDVCYTTLGQVGLFLNGVALFNWSDAQSYENADVWHNIAFTFEQYDFDICHGHAAGGVYHHHGYTACLADRLKDDGTKHSSLWGYATDGYPIYGPWQGNGELAKSCWFKRDYEAASPTGCDADGQRSCQLVDNENIEQGTVEVAAGPEDGSVQMSFFSGNPVTVDSGAYFEDYYYDAACSAADPEALDSRNGHDHDGLGYHFHRPSTMRCSRSSPIPSARSTRGACTTTR